MRNGELVGAKTGWSKGPNLTLLGIRVEAPKGLSYSTSLMNSSLNGGSPQAAQSACSSQLHASQRSHAGQIGLGDRHERGDVPATDDGHDV